MTNKTETPQHTPRPSGPATSMPWFVHASYIGLIVLGSASIATGSVPAAVVFGALWIGIVLNTRLP